MSEFTADDDIYYLLGLHIIGQQNSKDWQFNAYDGLGSASGMFDLNTNLK